VTADDFGAAREVNEAVELAHTNGILTAASLMMSGAAVDDAIARARRLPSLRVGLHLVLVDGPPVLPPERIPDLVNAQGRLRSDLAMAGVAIFIRPGVRRQLAAEIEAQFRAYRATGLPLDHVNAHHHFHVHPTVCRQVLDIGKRYGMHAIRVPREEPRMLDRIDPRSRHIGSGFATPWTQLLGRRVRRQGLLAPDRVFGVAWSGEMTEQRIASILRCLPDRITEIYSHPATTDSFAGATSGYRYRDELAALIAPDIKELVHATGAQVGGFSDFAAA
jgi:chitin disaccharide deacetylase